MKRLLLLAISACAIVAPSAQAPAQAKTWASRSAMWNPWLTPSAPRSQYSLPSWPASLLHAAPRRSSRWWPFGVFLVGAPGEVGDDRYQLVRVDRLGDMDLEAG
jgi:hypothetical protein